MLKRSYSEEVIDILGNNNTLSELSRLLAQPVKLERESNVMYNLSRICSGSFESSFHRDSSLLNLVEPFNPDTTIETAFRPIDRNIVNENYVTPIRPIPTRNSPPPAPKKTKRGINNVNKKQTINRINKVNKTKTKKGQYQNNNIETNRYEVEKILAYQEGYYLVHWKGFSFKE